jgi:hypothetical protein
LAELRAPTVDLDASFGDPALDLAPRADACVGEKLLNALGQDQ